MFFGLSPLEMIVLLGLGVVLFGPDKLPQTAASAARILRQIRAFSDTAKADLHKQLGPEFAELDLQDLNPRNFVRKNLLGEGQQLRVLRDELNEDFRQIMDRSSQIPSAREVVAAASGSPQAEGPRFDPEAT
jgi:sec-independent protein translocase protein TatB